MKRSAVVIAALAVAAVGAALQMSRHRAADPGETPGAAKSDSVWYHASNVALLAKTGRPQLVEFFHPD